MPDSKRFLHPEAIKRIARLEVRGDLFAKQLHAQLIAARVRVPIDVAQVVAGDVFAMLQKLDRLPEIGALVHPRKKTFDDVPGPNFQPRDPLDRLRMQKSF